ncbi:MAG: hypothetical protein IJD40_01275 [Lachnospiraceae bacterium]|nr:hypothetical protein [Lachnospiraceae bacterium]
MISDKNFLEFLNDKSLDLSKEKLEQIIEEELEKPENEMDADLIEYCLNALNELERKDSVEIKAERISDSKDNIITKPFKKVFAVAAAIAILTVGSFSVFAAVSDVSILDGLVELYNKYIVVRFDKSNDKADDYELLGTELAAELKENGIYPVLLPEALLSDESKITEIEYQFWDVLTSVTISFSYKNEKGYVSINQYDPIVESGKSEFPNAKYETTIDINGIQVHIFEQSKKGTITFKDGHTEYTIISSMNVEQAIEFAKTIK